jgi:hypothetical protein
LVSPGRVGREVTGADEGTEVGEPLVGMEVGAWTITDLPIITEDSFIDAILDLASGVSIADIFKLAAARRSCLEKEPVEIDVDMMPAIELERSAGFENGLPCKFFLIANERVTGDVVGAAVGFNLDA